MGAFLHFRRTVETDPIQAYGGKNAAPFLCGEGRAAGLHTPSAEAPKQAVLLMTYANTAESEAVPIKSHYEVLLKYLGWTDAGQVIASGVWPVGAIRDTKYPEQAYRLGKSVKKKA